ncbi:restriction endonuclease subunit S [Acinetobacter guillouiae]
MEFKQYPSYKNSGVEWLGDVPSHWDVKKIKRLSPVKRGASPRPINDLKYFDDNGEYAWVRISDVTRCNGYLFDTEQKLSELGASHSVKLEPESMFLSIAATVGKPCITKIKTCIHDGFVYFPKLKKHKELLFNIFDSKLCFVGLGKLGTQLNLNSETVEDIYISIPPDSEEEKVIKFLSLETTKIDTLIAKQEKLIELLEEQRKSIISHAVTKGLDPNVPMKDSGVEWLGNVPEHWNLKKFCYLFDENKKKNIGLQETNVLSLSYGNIKEKNIDDNKGLLPESFETYQIIKPNDIVFRFTDLQNDKRSLRSAISKYHGIITSAYIAVKTKQNADFYNYLFRAYDLQKVFYSMGEGMRQSLKMDELNKMPVVLPSEDEQKRIVSFLDSETSRIDNLIAKQEKLIEKLKEYRSSIISHAVTGKIDVREFVA